MNPALRTGEYRVYRSALFLSLGLTNVVFVAHGLFLYGWAAADQRMSLSWMALVLGVDLVGISLFTTRVSSTSALESWPSVLASGNFCSAALFLPQRHVTGAKTVH